MDNFQKVRPTIVEGMFYPDNAEALSNMVKSAILTNMMPKKSRPLALIVPYASYLYANSLYATAYSQVLDEHYDTVIVISPIHKTAFPGIALTESDAFASPIGNIAIDKDASEFLHNYSPDLIYYAERYHLTEHATEVQLPYILTSLGDKVKLLPLIMGEPNTKFTILLANALQKLIEDGNKKDKKYLIIVTTNLSHDQKYAIALEKDIMFTKLLKDMNPDKLAEQLALRSAEAIGGGGVITLLRLAQALEHQRVNVLKLFNSGDVTDDKLKVEGYISAVL